ncbi:hypothetical protein A4G19_08565 [Pasteurellaceae bacterium Macca]|nr:hypothetical protein [Pasteurellaceae bacterium Macca]
MKFISDVLGMMIALPLLVIIGVLSAPFVASVITFLFYAGLLIIALAISFQLWKLIFKAIFAFIYLLLPTQYQEKIKTTQDKKMASDKIQQEVSAIKRLGKKPSHI